ncbi:polysaccharide biosynthesis protein [Ruminococcaceae bacterium OttesenSCG-928-N02]|nr:polysaccharide biosynthesis protein [Ruminococcaceae bacterium OttesenSCG-928-N02]
MAKKETFIQGAFILVLTSVFVRFVGMFFRIYLSRTIGAEGMGLYQLIFSVYSLMCTVATAGISVAVTRLVAEKQATMAQSAMRGAVQISLMVAAVCGFGSMAIMYFGAQPIAMHWLKDLRAFEPLRILSFGLPAMAFTAVYRGYFVAIRRVSVQSGSQITEQLLRMAVIFIGLSQVAKGDVTGACVAVVVGNVVSEIAAAIYVVVSFYQQKPMLEKAGRNARRGLMPDFLQVMVPVALAGYTKSFLHTVENTLVPGRLGQFLGSGKLALAEFGVLKGMAMPIIMFPSAFLVAVAMLLVPEISEDMAAGREEHMQKTIGWALHLTIFVSILIALLFVVLARPISNLLYQNEQVAFYIKVLGPVLPFMYLESITEGLLRGVNQQASSMRYTLMDSAMRIILIIILVPNMGMKGFLFIMLVSNLFTSVLNLNKLISTSKVKVNWLRWVAMPVGAAFICSVPAVRIVAMADTAGAPYILQIIAGGAAGGVCYLIICLLLGCFTKNEYGALKRLVLKKKV